jgi:hypothetical protein
MIRRLVLLALVLALPALAQEPPKPGPVEKPKLEDLDAELRKMIQEKDTKQLIDELKYAARLSREGQKLLRFQVLLKVEISKVKSVTDRFTAMDVEKTLTILGKDDVRAELKKVATMPAGSDRETAYRAFAERHQLRPEAIAQAYQLQKANQRLDRLRADEKYVEDQLRELDRRATAGDLPLVSLGIITSNQTLEEALKDLDEMRKKTGTPTPVKPPVEKDNLDFLRDLVEPKK